MKYLVLVILFFTLLGCNEEKLQEEVKTVEWYKNNSSARKAKLKECADNPGELEKTPNCINAEKATTLSISEKPATDW